jgi:type IV pilus assembly protein PilV
MPIKTLTIMNKQPMNKRPGQIRKNRGFTLLEALLGFLVLSIGMLGIASLQAISLKAGKTSVYGSVAMMKVEELFESMRVNPTPGALAAYAAAGSGSGANNNCTGTVVCNGTTLAQDDIYWWKKNLTAGLPAAATTSISYTAAVAPSKMSTVTINVSWDERDKIAGGSVSRTYTTSANICTAVPC